MGPMGMFGFLPGLLLVFLVSRFAPFSGSRRVTYFFLLIESTSGKLRTVVDDTRGFHMFAAAENNTV